MASAAASQQEDCGFNVALMSFSLSLLDLYVATLLKAVNILYVVTSSFYSLPSPGDLHPKVTSSTSE